MQTEASPTAQLSPFEEAELRAYFTSPRPPIPGERSNFGAMATRLARATNTRSSERPTRGTSWTDLLECKPGGAGGARANFDGEDAMVAYIEARRRFRRVCEALAKLSTRDEEVLDAYYGSETSEHPLGQLAGVATLTETVVRRNRARAARGIHEPIEATVRWLVVAPDGRAALEVVRQEAAELVGEAKRRYRRLRCAG